MEPFSVTDRWIKWKDVERCPYTFKDSEWLEWSRKDDERLFLAALDNYADYLTQHATDRATAKQLGIYCPRDY